MKSTSGPISHFLSETTFLNFQGAQESNSKESIPPTYVARARVCKCLWSPEVGSPSWESIPDGLLKRLINTGSSGPVRLPYTNSVPSPMDCSEIPALLNGENLLDILSPVSERSTPP